jgi:response regulator of citrate/malate metabolism
MRVASFSTDGSRYAGRLRRGVNQHTLAELMNDAIRLGVITHAEMTAEFMGKFVVGTASDDAMRKYLDTLVAVNRPDTVALSNERA